MVSVVYYFLIPKSDYMLNYLKTEEEIKAWLEIYKYMKLKYFLGFLFGFLSAIPIAYSMC
jgi:Sec-independent protein secretion pathway component TatC